MNIVKLEKRSEVKKLEKTTKELIEEKGNMIKEFDQKIYESVQRAGIKSRAEGAKRRAELQELKDKGWYNLHTIETPVVVEPEIKVIIEPSDTLGDPLPYEPSTTIVSSGGSIEIYIDPEKEALKAQLEATKEKLKLLEAAKDMEEPEEVEIIPDSEVIVEEVIEEIFEEEAEE